MFKRFFLISFLVINFANSVNYKMPSAQYMRQEFNNIYPKLKDKDGNAGWAADAFEFTMLADKTVEIKEVIKKIENFYTYYRESYPDIHYAPDNSTKYYLLFKLLKDYDIAYQDARSLYIANLPKKAVDEEKKESAKK